MFRPVTIAEGPPIAAPRRAAIAFIFITVVLDVLALGIIIPVLPRLVEDFVAGDTARAARIVGVFGAVWALMQFVCAPILGALSDQHGRRPVILLSTLGLGLDYLFMALAPSVGWLFVGRVISGITASGFATAFAYIADVTPPEKRAEGFGLVGAAWGLGFVLGPTLGGILGDSDPRLPFWVAGALTLLNTAYGLLVLPETLAPERRERFAWKRANPVGSLTLLRSHPELFGLAGVNFLYYVAHQVLPTVFVLYAGYRYGWTAKAVGFVLSGVGIANSIVQGVLIRPIVRRLGARRTLLVGLLFGAIGFSIYGLATNGWAFVIGIPVFAFMGLFGPALQEVMTRHVSHSEQGKLQGANTSINAISGLIGPIVFASVFAAFIGPQRDLHLPGAPFLLASLLMVVAALAAWRVTRRESP
jgi:DHA1 family tetracycline resistance protein-like MFS transporter